MLGNNEPIKEVDLFAVFSTMVEELPWVSLKAFIQSNAQLFKACCIGGHRLDPKRRARTEKILLREAQKEEFSQTLANGVFAHWYPVRKTLHKNLEDHFHSDDYKQYRKDNGLEDDAYVLSDEVFDKFFKIEELPAWRILLCFSPLQFTHKQAETITSDAAQSEDLLNKVQLQESELAESLKAQAALQAELERLQESQTKMQAENQELRKARRGLTAEVSAFQQRFEVSQNENRKLREQLESKDEDLELKLKDFTESQTQDVARLSGEMKRLQDELNSWRTRYEKERSSCRNIDEQLQQTKDLLQDAHDETAALQTKLEQQDSFALLVLKNMDWPKVGAQLKLTPTMRRQFNSLIKKLDYEEDRNLTIEGTLPEFWGRLQTRESELIDNIAESNVREVSNGNIEAYWQGLNDSFADVAISLEARLTMLKMLQEIFYQAIDMDDLEEAKILTKKKAVRAAK
jgi:hypothetical protein